MDPHRALPVRTIICVSVEAEYFLIGPPETKCFTDSNNQLVIEKTKLQRSLGYTGYEQAKLHVNIQAQISLALTLITSLKPWKESWKL